MLPPSDAVRRATLPTAELLAKEGASQLSIEPERLASRLRYYLPLAAATVSGIALYWPLILGQQLYRRDSWRLLLGCRAYLSERLRKGEFPSWYPFDGLGAPFHAQAVCGVLHPLSWLAAVLRPERALSIQVLCAIALAVWGAWRLAGTVGAEPVGRMIAALSYGLCGYLAALTANVVYLWGAALLPLQLSAFAEAARTGWTRSQAALAVLAAVSTLAIGDLQSLLVFCGATFLFGLVCLERHRGRYLLGAGLVALLIGGLGAAQLVPSALLLDESARAAGLDWASASYWSMHPLRIPELLLAGFSPIGAAGRARALLGGQTGYLLWAEALGGSATVSCLAIAGLASGRTSHRCKLALVTLGMLGLLLALGRYGWLLRIWYQWLPLGRAFRFPEKYVPLFLIAWSVLAALGWQILTERSRRALWIAGGSLGVLAAVCAALGNSVAGSSGQYYWDLGISLATAAGSAFVLGVLASWKHAMRGAVLWLLISIEMLWGSSRAYDARPQRDSVNPPATVTAVQMLGVAPGRARVVNAGMPLMLLDEATLFSEEERVWMDKERAALIGLQGGLFRVEVAQTYLQGYPEELLRFSTSGRAWLAEIGPRFNVSAALVPAALADQYGDVGASLSSLAPEGFGVLRLKNPWPRAYLAAALEAPTSTGEWIRAMSELAPGSVLINQPIKSSATPEGSAEVVRYAPERVEVTTTSDRDGFLVLNDLFSRGWTVLVDHKPSLLLRANAIVRAVSVPSGVHHIAFEYEAPGLRLGAIISLMTACAWLALACCPGIWRRP